MKSDLFEKLEGYRITFRFYECDQGVSVEELYQAFKGRLMQELREAAIENAIGNIHTEGEAVKEEVV